MTTADALSPLLRQVPPLRPQTSVDEAAEAFLSPIYAAMLSIPVVDDERPVGVISRFQLNQIFLRRYGRELYGRHSIAQFMTRQPLILEIDQSLELAAQYVSANIGSPLREDFILTRDGRYLGMGVVVDLLQAVETRLNENGRRLEDAFVQLKSSQAALVQAEKMASLGQMVAGVAHEINTPLGYVRNNVEMFAQTLEQLGLALDEGDKLTRLMSEGDADDATIAEQLFQAAAMHADLREAQLIEDSSALLRDTLFGVDQIKELVVNLKNFSRLDQARVAEVSLNQCLEQTLTIAQNLLKGRVTVIKQYGELPPVSCSPSQINQVLLNIISNAAQAIDHDHGKLVLKTESDTDWVRVSIHDNGKGIAAEHLKKIFDPFFTTKAVGEGTGLGLSISFQIIQAHGGSIDVVSEPGRGTRFVVSLPRRTATSIAA